MKYTVFFGYMHRQHAGFATFPEALACFIDHENETPCAPKLVGEGYDFDPERGETSGLTEEEEAILEHTQARDAGTRRLRAGRRHCRELVSRWPDYPTEMAKRAYEIADAMIALRAPKEVSP